VVEAVATLRTVATTQYWWSPTILAIPATPSGLEGIVVGGSEERRWRKIRPRLTALNAAPKP